MLLIRKRILVVEETEVSLRVKWSPRDPVSLTLEETDLRQTWDWPETDLRQNRTMRERWRFSSLEHLVPDGRTDRQTDTLSSWRSQKVLYLPKKNFLISKLSYGWGFRRTMENILLLKFKISTMFCCIFSSHLSQEYKSYQLLQYCPCYKEHDKKYKLSQRVEQSLLQIKEAKRCVSLGKKDWCYNGVVTEHL